MTMTAVTALVKYSGLPAWPQALVAHDVINAHPLANDATTSIATADMKRFVEATGHAWQVLNLAGENAT